MQEKTKPLTVEELSKILYDECERDSWGSIDPFYFKNPPKFNESSAEEMGGLYELLDRVVSRINERIF